MKTLDIEKIRLETPATKNLIHFNNAGSSLPTSLVVDGMVDYLKREAEVGGYEIEADYASYFSKVYDSVAELINAESSEIALVENASKAWDLALASINFKAGDVVITTFAEYSTNFIALIQLQNKTGVKIEIINNDIHGQFSFADLKNKMSEQVKLVALTLVPSTNGLINPMDGVGDLAHQYGAYFLLDACQAVGQIVVDVKKLNCDFLAATGRKFLRAPRGTGFLFTKNETLKYLKAVDLFYDKYTLKENARRFESYETSFAARVGLKIAVDYALGLGMDAIEARVKMLATILRTKLQNNSAVTLFDTGLNKSGIITFGIKGHEPADIAKKLRAKKINISTNRSVFALELQQRSIPSILRASIHYYNTEEEIDVFLKEISKSIK